MAMSGIKARIVARLTVIAAALGRMFVRYAEGVAALDDCFGSEYRPPFL